MLYGPRKRWNDLRTAISIEICWQSRMKMHRTYPLLNVTDSVTFFFSLKIKLPLSYSSYILLFKYLYSTSLCVIHISTTTDKWMCYIDKENTLWLYDKIAFSYEYYIRGQGYCWKCSGQPHQILYSAILKSVRLLPRITLFTQCDKCFSWSRLSCFSSPPHVTVFSQEFPQHIQSERNPCGKITTLPSLIETMGAPGGYRARQSLFCTIKKMPWHRKCNNLCWEGTIKMAWTSKFASKLLQRMKSDMRKFNTRKNEVNNERIELKTSSILREGK